MRNRVWLIALALAVMTALGCQDAPAPGDKAPGGAKLPAGKTLHVRLYVKAKKRAVLGNVLITWSDPHSNDSHTLVAGTRGDSYWTHDADLDPHQSIVASVEMTKSSGEVTCWYKELLNGQEVGDLGPVRGPITKPGVTLECNEFNEQTD